METQTKTYNGWSSYETWAVKLWIDNDQGLAEFFNHEARCAKSAYDLSNVVKEFFKEQNPVADKASVYADLMNAALSEVNWIEIAESLIEDNKEEE